jgi:hypothetical protein
MVTVLKGQESHEVMRHGPQQRYMKTDMTVHDQTFISAAGGGGSSKEHSSVE